MLQKFHHNNKPLDNHQIIIKQKLDQISTDLKNQSKQNFLQKLFTKKPTIKSLYIYGGVGRGKSMLMQDFYNSLKTTPKIYFHFNNFMRQIHENLHKIRKENIIYKDELFEAIKRVVKNSKVICFDEFQVVDVADAMLLSRIFSYIFNQKILVIFTSNSHPKDLYKNGFQRENFLEFVEKILLKNCDVSFLDSNIDYRSLYKQNLTQRYFVSNKENRQKIKEIIKNFTNSKKLKPLKLDVWGRQIVIKKTYQKIAVINFDEICADNFSAADYQEISRYFDLIFLLKIPKLDNENINEVRRFLLFIDEVYENKVALIMLAKTSVQKIYQDEAKLEAFLRTISRINEIRSDFYWQNSKFVI